MKKLALAAATLAFTLSFFAGPLVASAQTPGSTLTPASRAAIVAIIAQLLVQVQTLEAELVALEANTASSTPATASSTPVTPSSAVIAVPAISVAIATPSSSYAAGSPITVDWSVSGPLSTDPTRLPYLEMFPVGANPIMVPAVRVARPAIGASTYTWIVSRTGLYGDTVAPGTYTAYVSLFDPAIGSYIIGSSSPFALHT